MRVASLTRNLYHFKVFDFFGAGAQTGGHFNFPQLTIEDEMNKLIIAAIATAFASTAFAQAVGETPKDKAKQAEVSATTKAAAEGADVNAQKAGAEANKLKAQKGTPKALTTKQEKQAAAAATTGAGTTNSAENMAKQAEAVNKAKTEKGQAKALPTKADKQKAVSGTTEGAVKKDGSN